MSEHREDDKVTVQKANFNVAGIIAAIALLLLVLGVLKFMHVSPLH